MRSTEDLIATQILVVGRLELIYRRSPKLKRFSVYYKPDRNIPPQNYVSKTRFGLTSLQVVSRRETALPCPPLDRNSQD